MYGIIYKWTSPNGKVYIGQTIHPENRRLDFLYAENYAGSKINNARKKYGPENFKYEVIEELHLEEDLLIEILNDREKFWIAYYDSTNPEFGYNIKNGGQQHINLSNKSTKYIAERIKGVYNNLKYIDSQQVSTNKNAKNLKNKYWLQDCPYNADGTLKARFKKKKNMIF